MSRRTDSMEGFVVRNTNSFSIDAYAKNVAKFVAEMMVDNVLGFNDTVTINAHEDISWGAFISDRGGLYVLCPGEIETVLEDLK